MMSIGMPAGLSQPERVKWLLMQLRGLRYKMRSVTYDLRQLKRPSAGC